MVHLVDIDEGNWRTPLQVAASQRAYVADGATILARAYAYRNARSRACLICEDAARRLYERFGFAETDRDDDEIIMTLQL